MRPGTSRVRHVSRRTGSCKRDEVQFPPAAHRIQLVLVNLSDEPTRGVEVVSPENKGSLLAIDESRRRAFIDVQKKLLAELDTFSELPTIKEPFRRAIMSLRSP